MRNEPTSEMAKNYPPSESASPYNAYYLRGCEIAERSPSYTSCLFKIAEHGRGVPVTYAPECNRAIERGICPAAGMREEEELKGVAMYFQPSQTWRGKLITNLTPESELPVARSPQRPAYVSTHPGAANFKGRYQEYVPKYTKPEGEEVVAVARPKRADPVSMVSEGGFADAINAAMRELPVETPKESTPVPQIVPVARPVIEAGESPLQYARRVAATL